MEKVFIVLGYIVGSFVLAQWLGYVAGLYQARREATFRKRAVKLFTQNGQGEEFLIVTGDGELVAEAYQIIVATSARAQRMAEQTPKNEGIALDDRPTEEQDTDRS